MEPYIQARHHVHLHPYHSSPSHRHPLIHQRKSISLLPSIQTAPFLFPARVHSRLSKSLKLYQNVSRIYQSGSNPPYLSTPPSFQKTWLVTCCPLLSRFQLWCNVKNLQHWVWHIEMGFLLSFHYLNFERWHCCLYLIQKHLLEEQVTLLMMRPTIKYRKIDEMEQRWSCNTSHKIFVRITGMH